MDFIQSHNRNQLEMMSHESMISQENPIRLIDANALPDFFKNKTDIKVEMLKFPRASRDSGKNDIGEFVLIGRTAIVLDIENENVVQ